VVWQDRSFQSIDCGTLALDESRMLTKEEQMEPEMTCTSNDTTEKMKFYMAMELSQKEWKLGFSVGPGQAHGRWRLVAASARARAGRVSGRRLRRLTAPHGAETAEGSMVLPQLVAACGRLG
jgi:hypothetical protein